MGTWSVPASRGWRSASGWQVERDHRDPGAAQDAVLEELHRDAMGCQKTIAGQILGRGADYLLVLNTARRSWR